jgi:lipopolysaccharide biosynthesis glycosyltransferase
VSKQISASLAIESAVKLFEAGKWEESNKLLVGIPTLEPPGSYFYFCVGRNHLYLGHDTEAEEWLNKAITSPAPFHWADYELARLKAKLNDRRGAAKHALKFIEHPRFEYSGINKKHEEALLKVAHDCFDPDIDKALAVSLYRRLVAIGLRNYLAELRIIEDEIHNRNLKSADAGIARLQDRYKLDAWGYFAWSLLQFLRRDLTAAVASIYRAIEVQPDAAHLLPIACHRLIDYNNFSEAEQLLSSKILKLKGRDARLDREIAGLQFRTYVVNRRHQEISEKYLQPKLLATIPNRLIVEATFKFTLPGEQITDADLKIATMLVEHLETDTPYTLGSVLALFLFYSLRRLWNKADALLERIRESTLYEHPEVVLRRFEMLCSKDLDAARLMYDEYYAGKSLSQWQGCVVLRFLAECRMWNEAGQVLADFIAKGHHFPDGEYFILNICRRAGLHNKLLDIIVQFPKEDAPAQFAVLERLLNDDNCIAVSINAADPERLISTQKVSSGNELLIKLPAAQHRSQEGVVGFLCTDRAYFLSVMTALASIASSNPQLQGKMPWIVFLEKSVPDAWATIVKKLAAKLDLPLECVKEEAFVHAGATHSERYGIFTGGSTLSRAAFLRIYAAKYLLNTGHYSRAAYFDSDLICQFPLTELLDTPMGTNLLGARKEEARRPEVRDAAVRGGIDVAGYFNSGVLVFNLSAASIGQYIDRAIHLAEQEPEKLTFHDQCALNIAFAGHVTFLEPQFNFFLRPHRPNNGDHSTAVLVHFLDRPKPWDTSYSREYREIWLHHARTVRTLLSSEDYNQVVAAANNIGEVSEATPKRKEKMTKKTSSSESGSSDRAKRKVKGTAVRVRRTR